MNKSSKIIGYTIASRYNAEYVVIGAIIPFVARFYEDKNKLQKLSRCGRDMVDV